MHTRTQFEIQLILTEYLPTSTDADADLRADGTKLTTYPVAPLMNPQIRTEGTQFQGGLGDVHDGQAKRVCKYRYSLDGPSNLTSLTRLLTAAFNFHIFILSSISCCL